ncbi:esterase [Diplodia corticola]|uniref:Esterase n=1 Tax=Diplodia corticola TaxID=236234 RepID=A0A1J9QQI4_9PEZI|nr:esterase [Diplodia corticola]OJD30713.1 esterase [Diplodia corticola]
MANADTYPPPEDVELPMLNAIPAHLVDRFDPAFVQHHNKYQLGRLHTHQIPIEWVRANPAKYAISYGRAHFPTSRVKISEQKCPVKGGGEITIRMFEPVDGGGRSNNKKPAYMNFHGGGWVFGGGLAKDHEFCKRLVHSLGCVAFDVDYRLAPEYPHPTQVEDCWDAFQWMRAKADEFGVDLEKLAVGGASAGGHLAAVVAFRCRDNGIPLAFQLLQVPVTDLVAVFTPTAELDPKCPYESYREMWDVVVLPGERMSYFQKAWLGNPRPAKYDDDWEVSPIKNPDLSKLAPALIVTAEMDPLRDEGEAYGRKMNEAGSKADVWRIPGVPHTVVHLDGILKGGQEFNERALKALSEAWAVPITP